MQTAATVIAIILFVVGIVCTFIPFMPDAIFVYAGLLIYGLMTRFVSLGASFYVIQGIVLVIIFLSDNVACAIGTRKYGGSKQGALGAIIGGIVSGIAIGPMGFIIGPIVGAIVGELIIGRDIREALKSGLGTFVGNIGGILFKLLAQAAMIVCFFASI